MNNRYIRSVLFSAAVLFIFVHTAASQTTVATYQGSLKDGGVPANGTFNFTLLFFPTLTGGSVISGQSGSVNIIDGNFTIDILNGSNLFTGADRFIEVHIARNGLPLTILSPRQQVKSAPYAIKSLTAEQLGGVNANQYVLTGDARLTDARNPLGGSANYINNSIATQSLSNFNIDGDGTADTLNANTVNANTHFSFQGIPVLISDFGLGNTFVGMGTGNSATSGTDNSFFGAGAGRLNTDGLSNSFFGARSGRDNTTGSQNSFFGRSSGAFNTTGFQNSFFGDVSGLANTTGTRNSFFGAFAGRLNSSGFSNSFFGSFSGAVNTTGSQNSFFGTAAGESNSRALNNSFFGFESGKSNTTGAANSFFGSASGQENTTGSDNSFFGVNTGRGNTTGERNSFFGRLTGRFTTTGSDNTAAGFGAGNTNITGSNLTLIGANSNVSADGLTFATALGAGAVVSSSSTIQLGRANGSDTVNLSGKLRLIGLGTAGATALCRNASNEIASCSSSIRYKSNVVDFMPGLSLIKQLRPVSFNWTAGGMPDLGLVAEEVAEAEPLLVSRNETGEVEGVKHDRVGVVLVNAVNEQQLLIEAQGEMIKKLQTEISALRNLLCLQNQAAEICQPKNEK